MQFVRLIQKKVEPFPWLYKTLIYVYSVCAEIMFFSHAIFTGKLFYKFDKTRFMEFLSRQEILTFQVKDIDSMSAEQLRQWFEKESIDYREGGWTFYLPPQDGLQKHFGEILLNYPEGSGLKILKHIGHPDKIRYTNHKQNPAPGAALKRFLTPSPRALMRVANYLYSKGLGIKVHDLVVLKSGDVALSCYVVQHAEGPMVQKKDYDLFINNIKSLLNKGELSTIHEETDIMWDFKPPDCSNNLIIDAKSGNPLYVDFQSFFLRSEKDILEKILVEIRDKVHFGGVRFYRGGSKYLYQTVPGLSIGKRDMETRWSHFQEMLAGCGHSFQRKIIFDVGCNSGLMLYNALSAGALWGVGWDQAAVSNSAEKLLLALGATRFNLIEGRISDNTDFLASVPQRFQSMRNGILFYLAVSDHIGFPPGISDLPWEFMFYEGHANQDFKMSMDMIQKVPWLQGIEVVSHKTFADGDTPKRVVILLRRN